MGSKLGTIDLHLNLRNYIANASTAWNRALRFNGTNQAAVNNTADYRSGDSAGALTFWFRTFSNSTQYFFSSGDHASSNRFLGVQVRSTGEFRVLQQNNDTTDNLGTNTVGWNDGLYHHAAVISNGSAWAIYLDGALQNTTVVSGANNGDWFADTANRDSLNFAKLRRDADSGFLTGTLDEFAVWNTVITANDVAELYNSGYGVLMTGFDANTLTSGTVPVDAWSFNSNDAGGAGAPAIGAITLVLENNPTSVIGIPAGTT